MGREYQDRLFLYDGQTQLIDMVSGTDERIYEASSGVMNVTLTPDETVSSGGFRLLVGEYRYIF